MPEKLIREQTKKSKLPRLMLTPTQVSDEANAAASGAGAADSGADSVLSQNDAENQEQRSQLRAAIKSTYSSRPAETAPLTSPTQQLIQQAQQFARQGDPASKEQAIQLFSQAVALSPADGDAWMWLGGMLLDQNLERAHYCLGRAVELDPQNERAKRGLASVTARLEAPLTQTQTEFQIKPATQMPFDVEAQAVETKALAIVPTESEAETDLTTVDAQTDETALVSLDSDAILSEVAPDRNTKIGLEEAVAVLREAGYDADPATVPLGGAKIREGLERGTLVADKYGIREARFSGLKLTITLLVLMALFAAFGIYVMLAQPNFKQILTQPPTPVPTATPLPDQRAATHLRVSFSNYSRYFSTFQSLTSQAINGKLAWSDFHNQFSDLNNQIKAESQNVNAYATLITPQLLEAFKELQDVAATANTASDYTLSGIENEQPADLQAGIRFFNQATSLLSDAAQKLEQVVPLTTPISSVLASPTITSTANGFTTPTPIPVSTKAAPNQPPVTTSGVPVIP